MESLSFIVLFSVVMVAWVDRLARACTIVRQVDDSSVLLNREPILVGMFSGILCSAHVPIPIKRSGYLRLRGDRRSHSGRGRPPLRLK
jgi:formate-dependent nitrite reductase membrane component NrfD